MAYLYGYVDSINIQLMSQSWHCQQLMALMFAIYVHRAIASPQSSMLLLYCEIGRL